MRNIFLFGFLVLFYCNASANDNLNVGVSCENKITNSKFEKVMFYVESQIDLTNIYMLQGPDSFRVLQEKQIDNSMAFWRDMLDKYPYSEENKARFSRLDE